MLYEIDNPKRYLLPDVILDFTQVKLEQLEPINKTGRVLVKNARGYPPTEYYKVSLTCINGYKISAELVIGGIDAVKKGKAVAHGIITKSRNICKLMNFGDYDGINVEILGSEHTYGEHSRIQSSREIVLRMTLTHQNP
jgi:hypothetical protein